MNTLLNRNSIEIAPAIILGGILWQTLLLAGFFSDLMI